MIPISILSELNDLAQDYAPRLLQMAKEILSQDAFSNTGELEESLKVSIVQSEDGPLILLEYEQQGSFLEVRKMEWTKIANVDKLKEWAKSATIPLGDIPGYAYGTAPNLSVEKQKERIAFAIAKSKFKYDKHTRKRWKKATLSDILKAIRAEEIEIWKQQTEQVIVNGLTGRSS